MGGISGFGAGLRRALLNLWDGGSGDGSSAGEPYPISGQTRDISTAMQPSSVGAAMDASAGRTVPGADPAAMAELPISGAQPGLAAAMQLEQGREGANPAASAPLGPDVGLGLRDQSPPTLGGAGTYHDPSLENALSPQTLAAAMRGVPSATAAAPQPGAMQEPDFQRQFGQFMQPSAREQELASQVRGAEQQPHGLKAALLRVGPALLMTGLGAAFGGGEGAAGAATGALGEVQREQELGIQEKGALRGELEAELNREAEERGRAMELEASIPLRQAQMEWYRDRGGYYQQLPQERMDIANNHNDLMSAMNEDRLRNQQDIADERTQNQQDIADQRGPQGAFEQWLQNPQEYGQFLKTMAANKQMSGAYGSFGPAFLAYRMLSSAYNENPALLPQIAPLIANMLKQPGATPEQQQQLQATLAAAPAGQPRDAQGNPIGLRQPEAPTGQTRSRGQFAASILPTIARVQDELSQPGTATGWVKGRAYDIFVGKPGFDAPAYAGLKTDLSNIATAWMRLHANSDAARQEFETQLKTAQSPQDLIARLNAIAQQGDDYAKMGNGRPDLLPGSVAHAMANQGGAKGGALPPGWKLIH